MYHLNIKIIKHTFFLYINSVAKKRITSIFKPLIQIKFFYKYLAEQRFKNHKFETR